MGIGGRAGALEIIDGSQRVRTLDNFLSDRPRLQDLVPPTTANRMRFSDFAKPKQMLFKRSIIRVIELTEKADEQARGEMFDQLKSGRQQAYPRPHNWRIVNPSTNGGSMIDQPLSTNDHESHVMLLMAPSVRCGVTRSFMEGRVNDGYQP